MSIKKARKTLQNKEKFNYDILDKVANSGTARSIRHGIPELHPHDRKVDLKCAALKGVFFTDINNILMLDFPKGPW